jgi:LysM repeat protein
MEKNFYGLLFASLFLFNQLAPAQPGVSPIMKINGVEFYQYTVQVSEGLFSIGRKFNISVDEITKNNPDTKNGLKAGQLVYIPLNKKTVATPTPASKTVVAAKVSANPTPVNKPVVVAKVPATQTTTSTPSPVEKKQEFITYTIDKKQTIFAISKQFNISQEELVKLNPDLQKGAKEGMVLRIPKTTIQSQTTSTPSVPVVAEPKETKPVEKKAIAATANYFIHVVQPDETLYSLAKRYKVELTDLIALNPGSDTKLVSGSELKIPGTNNTASVPLKKDTAKTANHEVFDVNKLFEKGLISKQTQKKISIAFLLPFMTDQEKKDPSAEKFVEFYQGALLALEEAKSRGISFDVFTYDTGKSENKLNEVLLNSELKAVDLIIGPAFSNQISVISDFAKENKINTLIPFSSKVADIQSNPYLFQFNSGSDAELVYATDLFTTGKYKNVNLVFAQVYGVNTLDDGKSWSDDLKKELRVAGRSYTNMELVSPETTDFSIHLQSDKRNIIIFNTDKFAYVSPYAKVLKTIPAEYNVSVFEQYSWRNQAEKLPKGLYLSAFVADMNEEKLAVYNQAFTHYYGKINSKENPRYDLLGFDLSGYFIEMISRYGKKFTEKTGTYTYTNGIQSKPRFERVANGGGFVNQKIYLIED